MKTKTELIADNLQDEIINGSYKNKLPSEQEIAKLHSTTTVTAGKALNLLRDRNVIVRVPRLGSFINREQSRPLKIYWSKSALSAAVLEDFRNILKKKFPQREIIIDTNIYKTEENLFEKGYDIIRNTATFKYSHSKYVEPLPDSLKGKYLNEDIYFKKAFAVHSENNLYYGIPIMFSPLVLVYNKDIVENLGKSLSPYAVTIDKLLELKKMLDTSKNLSLFDNNFAEAVLRYLVFSGEGTEGKAGRIDIAGLNERLNKYSLLFNDIFKSGNTHDFLNGNVVFTGCCRQSLNRFRETKFKWDILPLPEIPGKALPVIGEFLLVSNMTPDKQFAFEVAETVLSPEIQKLIAKHKCGLPVQKSLIPDTLDTRYYRDDIFLNELQYMIPNNCSEKAFNTMLCSFYYDLLEKRCSFEEFTTRTMTLAKTQADMVLAEKDIQNRIFADAY